MGRINRIVPDYVPGNAEAFAKRMECLDNYVQYTANNSGGYWWLKEKDWKALEDAGWIVEWAWLIKDRRWIDRDGTYLGAPARSAYYPIPSLKEAIDSFEKATGMDSSELGCSCCGPPHEFDVYIKKQMVDGYSPDFPTKGKRYEGK